MVIKAAVSKTFSYNPDSQKDTEREKKHQCNKRDTNFPHNAQFTSHGGGSTQPVKKTVVLCFTWLRKKITLMLL